VRPARIHVFDGLRVATEHIDHLQDGLHSSIEDLREAAGLGRIVRGFDVKADGPTAVVVGPGLAFDHARNRVAVDEPQRIDVSFPGGQDAQYLCAKYERVEDHQVEGKPTLVWDSTSLLLQPTLPAPTDDPIPLAKLVRTQDAGGPSFEVVALDAPAPTEAPDAPEPAPETTPTPPPAPAEQPALRVQQGVVPLPSGAGAQDGGIQALVAALRARLGGEPDGDVRVTLGASDVSVDFPLAGITCDTSLSAEVRPTSKPGWQCSTAAHGEATFLAGNVVAQYALSTGLARPLAPAEGVGPEQHAPELAESRLAQLSLAPGAASSEPAGQGRAAVERVTLAVRAAPATGGFGVVCELVFAGEVDEDQVAALEGQAIALSWSARIGWKAVGA
jgi:hypothetical protein